MPPPTHVAVVARKPNLLQVGGTPWKALPQRWAEGIARFIKGQRLERVLDLVGDLGIGEGPCALLLDISLAYTSQGINGGTY